jgi:hypothetical protein
MDWRTADQFLQKDASPWSEFGYLRLKVESSDGLLKMRQWTFGFRNGMKLFDELMDQ